MPVLFVENDDSFSWNVVEALPFERDELVVVRGPGAARLDGHDALVIGPGPLDPERAGLLDLVREAAARALPTLGICLGHQALGMAFGAGLVRAMPVHGRTSEIRFEGSRFFGAFREPMPVMRYHSLAITGVVPPLRVTATTPDGTVMALEHETLPMAGLQFHPDSYATPRGRDVLAAFFRGVA